MVYPDPQLAYLAPYAARCFESALKFHSHLFDFHPRGEVNVLLLDFADSGRASAGAVPYDDVQVQVAPVNFAYETIAPNERLNTIMNHELTHVVTMDGSAAEDRRWRTFFAGKVVPWADHPETIGYVYLTAPRIAVPSWYLEGFAVFMETWMAGGIGRAQGSYDEMVFRSMVRDGARFYDPLSLVSEGTRVDFQVGVNAYLYGTRFMSYLALQYGPETLVRWINRTSGTRRYFASQFKEVYGRDIDDLWAEWVAWEKGFQTANLAAIRQYPTTESRDLSPRALGSVSRAYYDEQTRRLYSSFNYPGVVAHVGAIAVDDGSIERLTEVKDPVLYSVTSIAWDPASRTIFYTSDNNAWRDLRALDPATKKSRLLIKDARIGDLVFNRADGALYGIRQLNGLSTLVRIPPPYAEWTSLVTWPYGQIPYDLDISPDGRLLSASVGEVSGRHTLRLFALDAIAPAAATPAGPAPEPPAAPSAASLEAIAPAPSPDAAASAAAPGATAPAPSPDAALSAVAPDATSPAPGAPPQEAQASTPASTGPGPSAPIAEVDFGTTIPSNFVFTPDGRYLYGSSYYTGVSNIFRYEVATGELRAVSNCETGMFRPVPMPDGSLVVFRYSGQGFVPAVIDPRPLEDVSAITFLGQQIAERYPVVRDWVAGSPADVPIDTMIRSQGPYRPLRSTRLESLFPIVEGYKDSAALGVSAVFSDPALLNRASATLSYSPDNTLPSDERLHVDLRYDRHDWRGRFKYNDADFYDLFGPTKRSRKGYAVEVGNKHYLIHDAPREMVLDADVTYYADIDQLPYYQNVTVSIDTLVEAYARLTYTNTRSSLGAVDPEKGVKADGLLVGEYVHGDTIPLGAAMFDFGLPLPIRHSSIWLRSAAGGSTGDIDDPFANFYFGGFGNNWVDQGPIKRYREFYAFPGVGLNDIGGRTFGKTMLEWNLPPIRFRAAGSPGFYLPWARTSVFAGAIATNFDHRDQQRKVADLGAQMDFRVLAMSQLELTFSLGYAVAFESGEDTSHEGMISLKILR